VLDVRKVNETKRTGTYLRFNRNDVFYLKQALHQWILRQTHSLIDLAGNGECNESNPIFVACFILRYG